MEGKIRLSIVGTAGRLNDAGRLTAGHYSRMVEAVGKFMQKYGLSQDTSKLEVCSGGAAWADHLVVTLVNIGAIKPQQLTIFTPVRLEYYGFEGEQDNNLSKKTANTMNYYHQMFRNVSGVDSIKELYEAYKNGCNVEVGNGDFKCRNSQVAQFVKGADGHLLAFTFGNNITKQPEWTIRKHGASIRASEAGLKPGGTADTWNKANCNKYHGLLGRIDDSQIYI